MPPAHERLTEQFYQWELRGRGWTVWPQAVVTEPPFRLFPGHRLPAGPEHDDGKYETWASGLVQWLGRGFKSAPAVEIPAPGEEPVPEPLVREGVKVLTVSLPPDLDIEPEAAEPFLLNLGPCREPVAFELIGTATEIVTQFVCGEGDAPHVHRQLSAHFPEAVVIPTEDPLPAAWAEGGEAAFIEFGLAREFMLPLAGSKADPFVGMIGALAELRADEAAVFQVLFRPVKHAWAESALRSVTDARGKPFFVNRPELLPRTKDKLERPLFAAVVRLAARAADFDRALQIVVNTGGAFRAFANPNGNELKPLANTHYPFADHDEDVLRRQSRRSGMLLNVEELVGFVHLPSEAVRTGKLRRERRRTSPAPESATSPNGVLLGHNRHAGITRDFRLTPEQRVRHVHIIGASGTGKSTLLLNLLRQDIEAGSGVALLDPHGDLVDRVLGIIPPERVGDVVLLDPADEEFSVGFNILSAHSDWERTLLASDLVSVFQRLSTSWGDQMGSVLSNAVLAFLESSEGGTLADLRRFLLEPGYRNRFLQTVRDPDVVYYWRKGFTQLAGNKSVGSALTRLETFLSPKPIRYMVSQRANKLDFGHILDSGKIFLGRLSQGTMGKENAFLLGSLLMAKFQQTAMARQRQEAGARRDFWLYVDEFHNFITPSLTELLSGARKYRVGLVLAHQELRQLERDREVASAVLSNCHTRVAFRVGDADARALASGFTHFEASDLQNLGIGEAVVRLERSDHDFNLTIPSPEPVTDADAAKRRAEVTEASRKRYATPRAEVEAALRQQFETEAEEEPKARAEKKTVPKPEPKVPVAPPLTPEPTPPVTASPLPVAEVPPAAVPQNSSAEVPKTATETKPPTDLGRGGEQHKAIQKRLKEAAEKLGYLVTAEKPVLEKSGSVDLALESSRRTIAVEITVTTTIDHEVGNVLKCLRAEFQTVAVVASSETKLRQMQEAVTGTLGAELSARVGYFTPDQLLVHLEQLAKEDAASAVPQPKETKRRGYTVKRVAPKLTPDELKAKEESALKTLADSMKKKPGDATS